MVALYLDDDGLINDPKKKADYRCYNLDSSGYRPADIPYNTPWLRWEKVRTNDYKKKIVIDPEPQYKTITKLVDLIPGQVTNLGYITLQKIRTRGTASISGVVKTEDGVLLEGAEVSSGSNVAVTDYDGRYSIDGLRLEVYNLEVAKPGYVSASKKITIRDMENRNIKQNFTLYMSRRATIRYRITPGSINDFNAPQTTGGTLTALVNKRFLTIPPSQIKNDDLKQFVNKTRLNFRFSDGKLTLSNSYAPIFYKHIPASSTQFKDVPEQQQLERKLGTSPKEPRSPLDKFKAIKNIGSFGNNTQHCPPLRQGDILLIDGGKVSNYKIKLLFEKIT